ncbi:hypothetical protein ABIA48_002280 [Pseudomonas sp. S30_BP2TU TE3576]|jgi:hypothetical protein|uniref:DUF2252 family protein n=1 Tax=Pseudomonas sp. S30_BP2TU TE3576 TaxID=3349329 RepID=UPI003D2178B9
MTTLTARLKQGRDARKNCPRSSQATLGKVDRDPIPLIKASSEGRVKSLVELRYGRMLVSPFTFYRGTLQADRRELLSRFHVQGMAFKVVGVGSVGKSDALARDVDRDEFFFTPLLRCCLYIALAHSRNYGLPALPRAFFWVLHWFKHGHGPL